MSSAMPSTSTPPKVGFLSLSAEIRNDIYELAYKNHNRINREIIICADKRARDFPCALARTCRQLRAETQIYFYEQTTMIFVLTTPADFDACMEWLDIVPDFAVPEIKNLRIKTSHCSCTVNEVPSPCPKLCYTVYQIDLGDLGIPEVPVKLYGERQKSCHDSRIHHLEVGRVVDLVRTSPVSDYRRTLSKDTLRKIFEVFESVLRSGIHDLHVPPRVTYEDWFG